MLCFIVTFSLKEDFKKLMFESFLVNSTVCVLWVALTYIL